MKYIIRVYLRKGRNAASERQRRRTQTQDCYIWHHIFFTHVVILYSDPHLALLLRAWTTFQRGTAWPSKAVPKEVSVLTACFFDWPPTAMTHKITNRRFCQRSIYNKFLKWIPASNNNRLQIFFPVLIRCCVRLK